MVLALLALTLIAAQERQLLPTQPEGWPYERLDFPLGFAPSLEYEGFEELYFGPGMFEEGAESYWSYVLALRIEEEIHDDEAFLGEFLEKYYFGICSAVGQSRDLELDLSGFGVTLERSLDRFVATVDMVDAFVTGEPLRLRIELDIHPRPGSTELFGCASPQPPDHAIWNELRSLRDAWLEQRPVPGLLNHLYVVPDPETYRALRDSEFLRDTFAVTEIRTTNRTDRSYTGFYLYGDRTYFEFLDPTTSAGYEPGMSGIAFGFERVGGTKSVIAALEESEIQTFAAPITREFGGEQVPWFEVMGVQAASAQSKLSLFSLEYVPEFLDRFHPAAARTHRTIARSAVLHRYASSLGQERGAALFQDITSITLRVDQGESARVRDVCRTLGHQVSERDGGWLCRGPQFDLALVPSEHPGRITAFEMRLRRPVEQEELHFGNAVLEVEAERAVFRFDG